MASRGQVHSVFRARVEELAEHAAAKTRAVRDGEARPWDRPDGWSGDPRDIPGLVAAYDRGEIDQDYSGLIGAGDNPGTTGDVVAVKTQADYTALQERALRTRYASSVRCQAHAAARWRGHGHPQGIFNDGIIRYVQDAIKAGGNR